MYVQGGLGLPSVHTSMTPLRSRLYAKLLPYGFGFCHADLDKIRYSIIFFRFHRLYVWNIRTATVHSCVRSRLVSLLYSNIFVVGTEAQKETKVHEGRKEHSNT